MRISVNTFRIILIAIIFATVATVGYAVKVINEPIPDLSGTSYKLELPTGQVIDMPRQRQSWGQ